jgi:hypothetical protein
VEILAQNGLVFLPEKERPTKAPFYGLKKTDFLSKIVTKNGK